MIVLLVLLGIIALGLTIGLIKRPKVIAQKKAFATEVYAVAAQLGWKVDASQVPNLYELLPAFESRAGNDVRRSRVTAQLTGLWRGVPVRAMQFSCSQEGVVTRSWYTETMLLMPRQAPGASSVFTDPRIPHVSLALGQGVVAAQFPGPITQSQLVMASADTLLSYR